MPVCPAFRHTEPSRRLALVAAPAPLGSRRLPPPVPKRSRLSPFEVSSEATTGYGADTTVSATRTATKLADLPISISVITDQFPVHDHSSRRHPGTPSFIRMSRRPQSAAFSSNIASTYLIHGFTAATMHDGFLAAGGSTPVATIAVDRVEVVKGPESLLYGEMNPGGLVNIVSKRPSPNPSTTITASTGSYDDYGSTLDTTGPITSDGRFTYRFMAST